MQFKTVSQNDYSFTTELCTDEGVVYQVEFFNHPVTGEARVLSAVYDDSKGPSALAERVDYPCTDLRYEPPMFDSRKGRFFTSNNVHVLVR